MAFGILLMIIPILMTNCKKDTITPAFTVTAVPVTFQDGSPGLQFYGKCTNDDVKMTKATITDPLTQQVTTWNLNGTTYVKDQAFALQADNTAYVKEIGTWTFSFVGNRTADNASFTIGASLNVTGK